MSSKNTSIRVLGQRSIPSTFVFRSSNRSTDCKDEQIKNPSKGSKVSLSDFLNRKLQKSRVLPKLVQGKERPFSSPVSVEEVIRSSEGNTGVKRRGEAEVRCVLDVAFEQLKCTRKEREDDIGSTSNSEVGNSLPDDLHESKKRRNPFRVGVEKQSAGKRVVVLGDDPKPEQKGKGESFIDKKKPRIHYNHYANGSGWWDCNMEGVDSEEVGCNEAWEGIGSTALGGLEWH